jgi:hypothetical protein
VAEPALESNYEMLKELGFENFRDFATMQGLGIYDAVQQEEAKVILDDLTQKDFKERQKK